MADRFTIYRVSDSTDLDTFITSGDPDDISALQRIDFNHNPTAEDLKNSKKPNQWLIDYDNETERGNADQQGGEKEMGDSEDFGVVQRVHKIEAIITNIPGQSTILTRLFSWADDPKTNEPPDWPDGAFGIYDSADSTNNLQPASTKQSPPSSSPRGLKLIRYRKNKLFGRNSYRIFLTLKESRGE